MLCLFNISHFSSTVCSDTIVQLLKRTDQGRPDKGTDLFDAPDHYYHEQFMESFSSASYSKLDDDGAWFSQEWRTEATTYDRLGRPDKISWRMVRKVRPGHEEILLDGTAQSVRSEEVLRDRSGQLDKINSQEMARAQNFVIGNDETELALSVESRSFVNRVNDIKCGKDRKEFPVLQEMEKNILLFGECLWL